MCRENIEYYLTRRRSIKKRYESLDAQSKLHVDANIEETYVALEDLFESEIRPGNGLDKALRRERNRILIEETARFLGISSEATIPYVENSDGQHPGMIFVPEGRARIGVDKGFFSREEPERLVAVPGFWLDSCAVTNKQYHDLYPSHVPDPHSADVNMPVVNVTWFDAAKFCAALGKRLPTDEEWERAARGPHDWIYSFGNKFDRAKAHIWPAAGTEPVSSREPNPWGFFHMSGNVWEWTSTIQVYKNTL